MKKVVLLEHVSLDGFVAGPNGEMDWIIVEDEAMWEYVGGLTEAADTALFGRTTYQLMEGYWPTAAESPTATKHDLDHAAWINNATIIVFSRTLEAAPWGHGSSARLIRDDIEEEMRALKQQPGKDMLMIGSASLAQSFMRLGLIDEYRLNVNPVVLGGGKPLFEGIEEQINLKLVGSRTFNSGVVGLHYALEG
jgi:dihydrofolate reductase